MPPQPKHGGFNATDSSFFVLFEQRRVPSPEERETIQAILVEKAAHLSHLNSQVPKRRSGKKVKVPRELRTELDYTRCSIKFHRALISPWRQLPVEVMSEIFLFTLQAESDELIVWTDHRRTGTMLLCKICSAWRAIALSTPALWNSLSLTSHDLRRPLDWVSTWLDRSRSTPLRLQLYWDTLVPPDVVNSMISTFASHLHHTVRLTIYETYRNAESEPTTPDPEHPYPELPLVESHSSPLLSFVAVTLPPSSRMWDWIHAVCRAAPRLTHLITSQFSLHSFPVDKLTHLDLNSTFPSHPLPMFQVFQIFEHSSNLEDVGFVIEGPAVTSSPRSLIGMKSISKMGIISEEHLGPFLEQAEFPSLVDLRLEQIDLWPSPEFCSFLSRSSCALTALDFYGCFITQQEIIACLQHKACNTLEIFSARECFPQDADALLEHLTYQGPEHRIYNPNLIVIQLHEIHTTDGHLSAMVESRLFAAQSPEPPAVARLNQIRFSFDYDDTASHPEDWKRLRKVEKMADNSEFEIGWPDQDYW
ncbi:hypothetical protein K438DRAFT_1751484 [Mycena galopus ATCC 62051]|nr:hypothetical protein K438DRAFT_1751484 [Mycena galopus ATCC 62051]